MNAFLKSKMNKNINRSTKVSDPLEIKQETYNPLRWDHTYFSRKKTFNIQSESNTLLDQTESYPPGITRIVDINDLLKNRDITFHSSVLQPPNREPTTPIPENLNKIKKEPPCENCMRNIEHFCIVCKKSWNYSKDTTQCSNCQSTLKLQCKICHKRFKFLNKVHQYILHASKELNMLSKKKQMTFTCEKTQKFVCSKCKYEATQKEQLIEHMEKLHGQTAVTNSHKKSAATALYTETSTNVPDKSISLNLFSKSNEVESFDVPTVENFVGNSPSISNGNKLLNISNNMQNLLQEVAQVKVSEKAKNPKKPPEINCNKDGDQYIEIFCPECKKTCKKIVYDEIVKPVCRECQQLMLYRCTLCTSRYKLLKYVRLHVKRVCWHRSNGPKLNCAHCDYKAEEKATLNFHIKSEHTPRICSKCNMEVENVAALKLHVMQCSAIKKNKHIVAEEPNLDDVPLSIRQSELMLKNYLNEKIPIDDDDSYKIVENNPEVLINEINKNPSKIINKNGWTSSVDYYCLQCDEKAKKKFSKYRPTCPKCKEKYDYRCINCEKLYGGYNSIYRHVKHECQNRFEMGCSLCDYISTRKYLLLNHIKSRHTIYKCLRCNCRCEGYISLRKHQSADCKIDNPHGTKHLKRLIALYCKYCYKRSIGLSDDNELVPCDKCTMIMSFQCLKCNKLFDDRKVAYKHVKEECKPTFLCDDCDYKAYIQYDLDVHVKYVHTIRRCHDCGVQFKDEYIFRLHRLEEIKKKNLQKKRLALENAVLPAPKRLGTQKSEEQ